MHPFPDGDPRREENVQRAFLRAVAAAAARRRGRAGRARRGALEQHPAEHPQGEGVPEVELRDAVEQVRDDVVPQPLDREREEHRPEHHHGEGEGEAEEDEDDLGEEVEHVLPWVLGWRQWCLYYAQTRVAEVLLCRNPPRRPGGVPGRRGGRVSGGRCRGLLGADHVTVSLPAPFLGVGLDPGARDHRTQ